MLTSQLGIRLILWMGGTVPTPAPPSVSAALTRVEVTNDAATGDGFQMTFTLSKERTGDYGLLQSGALSPMTRVVLGVLLGTTPEVLIDGIITHHQLAPSAEPGHSTLTVTGKDVSVMMDLDEVNEQYPNQLDSIIVLRLIAAYALYGLVPQVTPTTDLPIMLERIPRQHETDLRFIHRLAQKNGYVFYVEPVTFGVNAAYFGPETRVGVPQPALTMHMGDADNVKDLSFANDALAPEGAKGSFVEPITKTRIPIPPLPSLRLPPLAAVPAAVHRTTVLREAANESPAGALVSSAAAATRAPEAITGAGTLDAVRYGAVLRARKLVGVRGAGLNYDGNYYVRRVTHSISIGSYTQSFTLSRDGTMPLLPVVRP